MKYPLLYHFIILHILLILVNEQLIFNAKTRTLNWIPYIIPIISLK